MYKKIYNKKCIAKKDIILKMDKKCIKRYKKCIKNV